MKNKMIAAGVAFMLVTGMMVMTSPMALASGYSEEQADDHDGPGAEKGNDHEEHGKDKGHHKDKEKGDKSEKEDDNSADEGTDEGTDDTPAVEPKPQSVRTGEGGHGYVASWCSYQQATVIGNWPVGSLVGKAVEISGGIVSSYETDADGTRGVYNVVVKQNNERVCFKTVRGTLRIPGARNSAVMPKGQIIFEADVQNMNGL